MRDDSRETEAVLRGRAKACSDGLLAGLAKHHGPPIPTKVEIADDSAEVISLRGTIAEQADQLMLLGEQSREQQDLIKRQRELIGKLREADDIQCPRVSEVLEIVCAFYNVSVTMVLGDQRTSKLTLPRHIAFFLGREVTKLSLPEIGRKLGGKDHSTVISGIRRIQRQLVDDFKLQDDLGVLRAKIDARVLDRRVAALSVAA